MIFFVLPAGLTALCLAALARAQDVCYYPGGQLSNDIPCNPEAGTSMCCSSTAACLSSGLCRDTSANSTSANQFVRATCTDQTWSSDACPPYCVPGQGPSGTTLNLHWSQNNVHIQQCNDSSSAPAAKYCCGYVDTDAQCCDQPAATFELLAAAMPQPLASNPEDCTPSFMAGPSSTASSSSTSTTASSSSVTTSSSSRTVLTPPLAVTSSSTPSSTPTNSIASAETPLISQSATTSISTGSSATLVVSTRLPTATSSSLGSVASSTSSTLTPSAFADSLPAPSTSETENSNSGLDAVGSKGSWPSGLPHKMSSGLSTGKIVGIGLGASVAGAGLVAISVYLWARRRMYKKQQQRWQEQMDGLDRGMAVQTADGEPSMVMLRRPESMASSTSASGMLPSKLKPVVMRAEGNEGAVSPSSSYRKEMAWETSTIASSEYSQEPERPAEMDSRQAPPTRAGRTATWLGRHSVYEMP